MRTSSALLLTAVSLGLLLAAYFLLPQLSLKPADSGYSSPTGNHKPAQDAPYELLYFGSEDVVRLASPGAPLSAGEPLYQISEVAHPTLRSKLVEASAIQEWKDWLLAAQTTNSFPADLSTLEALLASGQLGTSNSQVEQQLSVRERELLEAEAMGLEDAATELISRLSQLEGTDSDAPLVAELKQVQNRLRAVQRKLAAPQMSNQQRRQAGPNRRELEQAKRTLLSNWPRQVDTFHSTQAGFFHLGQAGGPDTLFTTGQSAYDNNASPGELGAGYYLQARGQPALLATAKRVDSAAARTFETFQVKADAYNKF